MGVALGQTLVGVQTMVGAARTRLALCGIDFPHAAGYRGTLQNLPDVEVVAFYDPDPARTRALLEPPYRDVPVYADLEALIAEARPDAAMLSLPHDQRPRLMHRLVDAGVHLWVEKPGATSSAVLKDLVEPLER